MSLAVSRIGAVIGAIAGLSLGGVLPSSGSRISPNDGGIGRRFQFMLRELTVRPAKPLNRELTIVPAGPTADDSGLLDRWESLMASAWFSRSDTGEESQLAAAARGEHY
jgi:hypothetical protein